MTATVHAFAEDARAAHRLALGLGVNHQPVRLRQFPDGESLVQVGATADIAILYRSLNDPNRKLIEIALAASALRDRGARRILLVAPYLPYMRQDRAFAVGQAVSQRVVGQYIAMQFDGFITVDPHLHRTPSLDLVAPGCVSITVSAAPVLAEALQSRATDAVIVGPDVESAPWVEAIAAALGRPAIIGRKKRLGDRSVELTLPGIEAVDTRRAMIVDDMVSTGITLAETARRLRRCGITQIEAAVVHCLARPTDIAMLRGAGIKRLQATDSTSGRQGVLPLAPVLVPAVRSALAALPA